MFSKTPSHQGEKLSNRQIISHFSQREILLTAEGNKMKSMIWRQNRIEAKEICGFLRYMPFSNRFNKKPLKNACKKQIQMTASQTAALLKWEL